MSVPLLLVAYLASPSLSPVDLRCEAQVNPVGIGVPSPRLSWKLDAAKGRRNLRQTRYRILAATDPKLLVPGKVDLWDSGEKSSDATSEIVFGGKVPSNFECWWTVQVFDQDGKASGWSKPARWTTGLLAESDWKAEWIGYDEPRTRLQTVDPYVGAQWIWPKGAKTAEFSRTVPVREGLSKAVMRLTVDDRFEFSVNGKQVLKGEDVTDSWRRPATVDLTKSLSVGDNVLTVNGRNLEGEAGFLGVLELTYADGKTERIPTDGRWQVKADGGAAVPASEIAAYGGGPWGKVGERPMLLPPPRLLRSEFTLGKPIKRATLYGAALGLADLHLNGKKVGNEFYLPGWTDYGKRVYARGYDVTASLKKGANALGVVLGDGWYSGYVGYGGNRDLYGSRTRARVQLVVDYVDGTREVVGSSSKWKAATGPIQFSDFLQGETYDARKEIPGWDKPGFTGSDWKPVDTGAEIKTRVEPFNGQPVVAFAELKAKKITEPKKGVYLLDLGQNFAGFARLKVKGKAGQAITLRFGERLNPDGTLYVTNLRGARTIDTYICKGEGVETWSPKFTFHGFQYVEVSGLGHKPSADEVVGVALSSDTPRVGTIETSSPMLNQLVSNAWWTQRANFIDIPTDCPQRDERLGWTGDAQAYVRTAAMLADVQPFFTKWLITLDDGQRADGQYPTVAPVKVSGDDGGPAWADAGVICPWTIYDVYGDRQLLARHYPNMKRFVEFCRTRSGPELLPPSNFHCFGDWLSINANTPNTVIYQAYFAGSARILSQAAAELGKKEEAAEYEDLYRKVRASFQKAYTTPDGKVSGDTQCAYILALGFDLLEEKQAKLAADRLVADIMNRGGHLSTGFVGTRDIMHVLSKIGRNDVAFRLLHNTTFPSWGFTIKNGATSIWERWDGWTPEKGFQDPGMNSFAHYAFGAVVGWVMAQPAGIQNLEPGFKTIKIAPQIDPNLKWLKSSYDSVRGKIVSEWSVSGDELTIKVVVPPNTKAEVHVPNGKVEKVGSGEYVFRSRIKR